MIREQNDSLSYNLCSAACVSIGVEWSSTKDIVCDGCFLWRISVKQTKKNTFSVMQVINNFCSINSAVEEISNTNLCVSSFLLRFILSILRPVPQCSHWLRHVMTPLLSQNCILWLIVCRWVTNFKFKYIIYSVILIF